jgi:hypothetical protein
MKTEVKRNFVRVIPQFTIRPNVVSLIAEENAMKFRKGDLVMQVSRSTVYEMIKPLQCEIVVRKDKNKENKYVTKVVTAENAPVE